MSPVGLHFAPCVWMPDFLPPVGRGSSFAPFFWEASRRSPQPSPCPPASLSQEDNSDRNPFSSHRKSLGLWRPPGHSRAGARRPPDLGLHPHPREGVEVPAGRGAAGLPSLPPDARARPVNACGVVCVCVSHADPPSPNRPPQQFAIPYKFGNRFLKNSMTHNGDGAGEGSGTGAPNLRVTDCKNLGRRGAARAPTSPKCTDPRWGGAARGPGGASRGRAGPPGSVRTSLHRYLCLFIIGSSIFLPFIASKSSYCFFSPIRTLRSASVAS